jgi:hypothetical protein
LYSAAVKMKPSNSATFFCQRFATSFCDGAQAEDATSSKNGSGKSRRSTTSTSMSACDLAILAIHWVGTSAKRAARVEPTTMAILGLDIEGLSFRRISGIV